MTLYHYCSAAAFESIIRNRSIWLSSLASSNDTQEGVWLGVVLRDICYEFDISDDDVERVLALFRSSADYWDSLGFCLTAEGDMLSQWRGYADDGCGFAIGFSEEGLKNAALSHNGNLLDVVYDRQQQLDIVRERFPPIIQAIKNGAFVMPTVSGSEGRTQYDKAKSRSIHASASLSNIMLRLVDIMYKLKNPAFHEENESRLVVEVSRAYDDCDFHMSGRKIVPHRTVAFGSVAPEITIERIVIGPRNPTAPDIIAAFLRKHDFFLTDIGLSTATYRAAI